MYDAVPGLLFSTLPWWLAAPLVQLTVLVFGMALDETYVNRATVLTAAIAVQVHGLVAADVGVLVGLYADAGLVVGAYGLYAYVVDAYVDNWFRILAYFVYSPLSAFLVILTAGPTLFGIEIRFVPALVLAGYANLASMAALEPTDPYYFGPASPEQFGAAVESSDADGASGSVGSDSPPDSRTRTTGSAGAFAHHP